MMSDPDVCEILIYKLPNFQIALIYIHIHIGLIEYYYYIDIIILIIIIIQFFVIFNKSSSSKLKLRSLVFA